MTDQPLVFSPALDALGSSSVFGGLSYDALLALVDAMEEHELAPGDVLWEQSSEGDTLHFVLEGRMRASRTADDGHAETLGEAGRAECLGEASAIADVGREDPDRAARIEAVAPTRLLRLSRDQLTALAEDYPEVREALLERARQQLTPSDARQFRPPVSELVDLLAATDLCDGVDRAVLEELANEAEWLQLPGGTVLAEQGAPSDSMYFLLKGRMAASIDVGGFQRVVGYITQGQVVGEIGVISDVPRTATVRAVRDCEVARLTWVAFEKLVRAHPDLMIKTTRLIVQRLTAHKSGRRSQRAVKTVTLVPSSPDVPVMDLAARLEQTLARQGTARVINAAAVESELGVGVATSAPGSEASRRLGAWLDGLEDAVDFVIYVAHAEATAWSRRAERQADHLLLVGVAGQSDAIGQSEWMCLQRPPTETCQRDLVLLHPTDDAPSQTASWTLARNVTTHHHVRLGRDGDVERLARALTGRSVGLVLSGGAARCMAHVGVVRALREAGVPIDLVGGTSFGAIIAAQLACEWSQQRLFDGNQIVWTDADEDAVEAGARVDDLLAAMFGDRAIEDLWLRTFCVSSSLTRAAEVIHDRGLLRAALRASVALPGVVAPVVHQGEALIDGAVLNNLPTDVMRARAPGYVIAVDVNPTTDLGVAVTTEEEAVERGSFWSRLVAGKADHGGPGLRELITRLSTLAGVKRRREVMASSDLFVAPDTAGIRPYDWESFAKLEATGYLAATEALRQFHYPGLGAVT